MHPLTLCYWHHFLGNFFLPCYVDSLTNLGNHHNPKSVEMSLRSISPFWFYEMTYHFCIDVGTCTSDHMKICCCCCIKRLLNIPYTIKIIDTFLWWMVTPVEIKRNTIEFKSFEFLHNVKPQAGWWKSIVLEIRHHGEPTAIGSGPVNVGIHTWNSPEKKKRRSPSIKSECLSHVTRSVSPLLLSSRFSKLTRGAAAVATAIMAIDTLVSTPRATISSVYPEAVWRKREDWLSFIIQSAPGFPMWCMRKFYQVMLDSSHCFIHAVIFLRCCST